MATSARTFLYSVQQGVGGQHLAAVQKFGESAQRVQLFAVAATPPLVQVPASAVRHVVKPSQEQWQRRGQTAADAVTTVAAWSVPQPTRRRPVRGRVQASQHKPHQVRVGSDIRSSSYGVRVHVAQ